MNFVFFTLVPLWVCRVCFLNTSLLYCRVDGLNNAIKYTAKMRCQSACFVHLLKKKLNTKNTLKPLVSAQMYDPLMIWTGTRLDN